jgi:hypothetical protein
MDFVLKVRIMIDFYTTVFSVWSVKRRISDPPLIGDRVKVE